MRHETQLAAQEEASRHLCPAERLPHSHLLLCLLARHHCCGLPCGEGLGWSSLCSCALRCTASFALDKRVCILAGV